MGEGAAPKLLESLRMTWAGCLNTGATPTYVSPLQGSTAVWLSTRSGSINERRSASRFKAETAEVLYHHLSTNVAS